ncbi:MAG: four helix bundle protein [Candidatus Gracilibacteria bacterium]|nr:four helix bundle protein [Candidatus Gracilibacteria bacterium]
MATYDNLPVYKESYDLLILTFSVVKNFEKQYKYTIGDKIKNEIVDLITSIYRANSSFETRLQNIKKSREQIEVLKLYFRLSRDLKIIKLSYFADLSFKTESLSKQLYSWENSIKIKKETKIL